MAYKLVKREKKYNFSNMGVHYDYRMKEIYMRIKAICGFKI